MSLISDKELEEAIKDITWDVCVDYEELTPSDVECGVKKGIEWTQQKIIPLFVEFANYCKLYETNRRFYEPQLTTKEVFVLWCEEREKK